MPVVTSWMVVGTPEAGWPTAVPVASVQAVPAPAEPTTIGEQSKLLGRELGLNGTVKEVIEGAAMQLGIETLGKPLKAVATECMQAIGVVTA